MSAQMAKGVFIKKIPTSSVSPTFKLNLPSEVAAANLGSLLTTEFELRLSNSPLCWTVSISKRRNKDKHEYLLVGWRKICEELDVRCGDCLEFAVYTDHLEFKHIRTQPKLEAEALPKPCISAQKDRSTSSSEEMHLLGSRRSSYAEAGLAHTSAAYHDRNSSSPTAEAPPLLPQDHLLNLLLDDNGESLEGEGSQLPVGNLSLMEEPLRTEASLKWLRQSPGNCMDWDDGREDGSSFQTKKRRADNYLSPQPWPNTPKPSQEELPKANSYPSDRDRMKAKATDRPVIGFQTNAHSSGIRFNATFKDSDEKLRLYLDAAQVSEAENDRLRVLLYEERERATRAEMRNMRLLHAMAGAESVLERQTSRGLNRLSAIVASANRLMSRDIVQQIGMPLAHHLGAHQSELKQLTNEAMDALWSMRGLTNQQDVPARFVAEHPLPAQRKLW